MITQALRYATLLLCGGLLTGKVIFLHRFFTAWNQQLVLPLGIRTRDVILYHLGVTVTVAGVGAGTAYSLIKDRPLNPLLVLSMTGLTLLNLAIRNITVRLPSQH